MDLAKFLTARLDEDEASAKEALTGPGTPAGGSWTAYKHPPGPNDSRSDRSVQLVGCTEPDDREWLVANAGQWGAAQNVAVHIARHDPARVLREVDAKRSILAQHPAIWPKDPDSSTCSCCGLAWPCPTLRALAAAWSDHPDYDPAWKK